MEPQRIILPLRVTSFRAVCAECQANQPESRGYMGSIIVSELAPDQECGSVVCRRGHEIELVRETPADGAALGSPWRRRPPTPRSRTKSYGPRSWSGRTASCRHRTSSRR
jgi:hypothetical protein